MADVTFEIVETADALATDEGVRGDLNTTAVTDWELDRDFEVV